VQKIAARDAEGARRAMLTLIDKAEEDVRHILASRQTRQTSGE